MARPKVHLETSVIGYLTARPSRDLIVAACQRATQQWWVHYRGRFDLYTSVLVIREEEDRGIKQATWIRTADDLHTL